MATIGLHAKTGNDWTPTHQATRRSITPVAALPKCRAPLG
jgi:hypothetical protein